MNINMIPKYEYIFLLEYFSSADYHILDVRRFLLEQQIILSKMQARASNRYQEAQGQDIAISSLLEIDLREQEEVNIWEDRNMQNRNIPKRRTYSYHKAQPKHTLPHPHPQFNHLKESRSIYQLALLKEMSHLSDNLNPQQNQTASIVLAKSTQFNQGEYWSSRVNWMSEQKQKGHSSQPKLNKKYSFGYEVNGRKSGQNGGRYGIDEKTRQNQYKTNLIYSLLTHREGFKNKVEENAKGRGTAMAQSNSNGKIPLKRISWQEKEQGREFKLTNQAQQYMRETLKKLYLKNRNEDSRGPAPAVKQSEHSSMIRELLINIENIKDFQNNIKNQENNPSPSFAKENGKQSLEEMTLSCRIPQRKLHLLGHHNQNSHQGKHVVNLNQQAQKCYPSRSIHQGTHKLPQTIKIQ